MEFTVWSHPTQADTISQGGGRLDSETGVKPSSSAFLPAHGEHHNDDHDDDDTTAGSYTTQQRGGGW